MITFANHSAYTVRVSRRTDLTRSFPYQNVREACEYLKSLRAHGYAPRLEQGDDRWRLRIKRGHGPSQYFDCNSLEEAHATLERIKADQKARALIDPILYHATYAKEIARYAEDESTEDKEGEVVRALLQSFLTDLGGEYAKCVEAQRAKREQAPVAGANSRLGILPPPHIPRPPDSIAWLLRPLAYVTATDINAYIQDRLADVASTVVDREIDLLSQVIARSIEVYGIERYLSPLHGVKRPSDLDRRSRRLTDDEKNRLFKSAREEDRLLTIETTLEEYRAQVSAMTDVHESTRRRRLRVLRDNIASGTIAISVIPYYETFIRFLMITAAQRSEALALKWSDIDLDSAAVSLPDNQNGHARVLDLDRPMMDALSHLPRTSERVFPLELNQVHNAWFRIVTREQLNDFHMYDLRGDKSCDSAHQQ